MVVIKTTKEIHPKIYAYTTPTVTSNEGWIKIGYTERDVTQRIKEQTHTAHIATDVLWTGDAAYTEDPDKGKTFKDHDFHHFLSFHDVGVVLRRNGSILMEVLKNLKISSISLFSMICQVISLAKDRTIPCDKSRKKQLLRH